MKFFFITVICAVLGVFQASANINLYGVTMQGGDNGYGTLFKYNASSNTHTVLKSFDSGTDGAEPTGQLLLGSDNKYYGTANSGGSYGYGVLFQFDPATNAFNKLVDFDYYSTGSSPYGSCILTSDGKIAGTNTSGGTYGYGTIWEYDLNTSTVTVLFNFDYTNTGGYPYGSVMQASNGKLYGTTANGGIYDYGTLYEFDPQTSNFNAVKHFDYYTDGGYPQGGRLTETTNGDLYGTTANGGTYGAGTVFQYNINTAAYTKRVDFDGSNGGYPYGVSLFYSSNGLLYGTNSSDGNYGSGCLFSFDPTSGNVNVLHHFDYYSDGVPYNSVMQAADGNLYGMTYSGGSSYYYYGNAGTIYQYNTTTSTFTSKIDFNHCSGAFPYFTQLSELNDSLTYTPPAPLVQVNLYGVAQNGGSSGNGTLFRFGTGDNMINVKNNFDYTNGGNPAGKLLYASNGKFYGTTTSGGNSGAGTIFEFDPVSETYSKLAEFDYGTTGSYPYGHPVQLANGKIVGTNSSGGASGNGTLWEYDIATNTLTSLFSFDYSTTGGYPYGSVMQASNGKLYGTTWQGGVNGYGTLYEFNPQTNTFALKFDFDYNASGGYPVGKLTETSNGDLYGACYQGGGYGYGTLFQYNVNTLVFTKRYDFDYTNGANCYSGALCFASNGLLYGTTTLGSQYGYGNLFSFDPASGTLISLHGFNYGTDGISHNPLVQASNGNLYGMTYYGSSMNNCSYYDDYYSPGTIYEFNIGANTYTSKAGFNYTNGAFPFWTGLAEDTIPVIDPCSGFEVTASAGAILCAGGTTTVNVSAAGGTGPYAGTGSFTVSAGTYSYTVTDANGCTSVTSVTITEPTVLMATASAGSIACFAGTTTVNVTATGGIAPYSGTGSFTVSAGTYSYTVTDANGCTSVTSITISQPAALVAGAGPNQTVYFGYNPKACATLTGSATGGTAPYTYAWSTGASSAAITVCPSVATTYTLTVRDARGCVSAAIVKVCVINVKCTTKSGSIIYNDGEKVLVCHVQGGNRTTMCLAPSAVAEHLAHGDQLGTCGSSANCFARVRGGSEEPMDVIETDVMNLMAYPNPFDEATIIRFSLPVAGKASLKVYNMFGEEVQVLFEGEVLENEAKEVVFKGTDLANGIYMVKLMTASGEVKAEKVLLSR